MGPPFSLIFPYAFGEPSVHANFRSKLDDFRVVEQLGFEPADQGEHCFLRVRKRGHNTHWLGQQLAQFAGIGVRDIGYCGLKDRHAVTEQWFSLYDPLRREVDWSRFTCDGIEIIETRRHTHKLKPGEHRANAFTIVLRDLRHATTGETIHNDLAERLRRVALGVPNYFGEQRFGHDAHNLQLAHDWFCNDVPVRNKKLRGLVMSAARAYLFNHVLAARVRAGNWNGHLSGDEPNVATGPLWGRGRPTVSGATLALEQQVLQPWARWCERLEHVGLQQQRRELVLVPQNFTTHLDDDRLQLTFSLPAGEFATALLREIAVLANHQPGVLTRSMPVKSVES